MDGSPDYTNPPLIETAISIQFRPLKDFKNVHLWEFWSQVRGEYPSTEDQEPIDLRRELFGAEVVKGPRLPQIQFRPHASRLQAMTLNGGQMIQIQNGRFVFNWRRIDGGTYPRWTMTSREFAAQFNKFAAFVDSIGLGTPTPLQWEVVYVNHLMAGTDWSTPNDWPDLLPGLMSGYPRTSCGQFEQIELNLQKLIPDRRARLRIGVEKQVLLADLNKELLRLTLTATGEVSSGQPYSPLLDFGHGVIVTTFNEITGDSARQRWRQP